jgi:hypothetical protein
MRRREKFGTKRPFGLEPREFFVWKQEAEWFGRRARFRQRD